MAMQKKILLFFIAAGLLPMIIVANIVNILYQQMLERKVVEISQQTLMQISNNVDMLINNMISASNIIILDHEIIDLLDKQKKDYQSDKIIGEKIIRAQGSVLYAYNSDMVLYDFNGNYYTTSRESAYQNIEKVVSQEWFKKTLELDGFVYWTSPDQDNLDFADYPPGTFCMSRVIKDRSYKNKYGVLLVCVYPSERQSSILGIEDMDTLAGDFYVIDNNNIIIMSSDNTILGSRLEEKGIDPAVFDEKTKKKEIEIQGEKYILNCVTNLKSSFKIVQCISEKSLMEESVEIRRLNVRINVLVIIILLISAMIFSKSIIKPITQLCSSMKLVGEGDFSQSIQIQGNSEITVLAKSYNLMINKIQKLVTELEESYIQRENLRYKSLQMQINPHFILNTLNGIRIIAMLNGDEKASGMIMELGKMLEHILGRKSEMVCLNEEIRCIESYCAIQKMRYGDNFNLELNIDEKILEVQVPVLLLQPLIENAIIHGIGEGSRFGKITISGYREGDFVVIEVEDNGKGMSREEIDSILNTEKKGKATGIGIKNVSDRIDLIYGHGSTLEMISTPEQGTTVRIRIYEIDNGGTGEHD